MNYQKAKNEDIDYIIGLFNPGNTVFMSTQKVSREVFAMPNRSDYILMINNDKIGWFNIRKSGEFGMIIDKPYQGKGYGKQALVLIEKEAKNLGHKKLKLTVNKNNIPAVKIYKSANFKETDILLKMEKDI